MAEAREINVDLAALTREDGTFRTMLAWGDPVSVVDEDTSGSGWRSPTTPSSPTAASCPRRASGS